MADTTLVDDLGRKRPLHARAGVAHYWVADVNAAQLHLFTEPRDGDYQRVEVVGASDAIALDRLGLAGVLVVADLFGAVVEG